MQAADVAKLRGAIVAKHRRWLVVSAGKHNRLVAVRAEASVDARSERFQALVQCAIARDHGTAWCPKLNKDKASAQLGVLLQQGLGRQQALFDSFGVVDAIDAQADQRVRRKPELLSH